MKAQRDFDYSELNDIMKDIFVSSMHWPIMPFTVAPEKIHGDAEEGLIRGKWIIPISRRQGLKMGSRVFSS